MPIIFWDASGLVKRYYSEAGSETVDAIFQAASHSDMQVTLWGYAESFAILHRKRNAGSLASADFTQAATKLQDEVLVSGRFGLLTIKDDRVLSGLSFVVRHNLKSNDAAILATYLRFQQSLPLGSPPCFLVASDQRPLRATEAEGLETLNPERINTQEIAVRLAGGAA